MTPEITLRTFTDDQYILDKIFYANNYRLKNFADDDNDVCVVDVGAHAGYFSLLCLLRGAKKVYSIEPFADNFRVLNKNLEAFAERLTTLKMGVYTESKFANISYPPPENNFFYLSHINFHDGGDSPKELANFCTLDELLNSINEEKVTLLKLHLGYAESDILISSDRLDKCEYVCGETSASPEKMRELIAHMGEKGFEDSFLAESKEQEGTHLFLFAKDKCENLFNLYAAGSPEEIQQEQEMANNMTQIPEQQ